MNTGNVMSKPATNRSPLNLPTPKPASNKARTLGSLKLPVAKGPAQRGGCCGR
jgi:hypothetical protein